MFGITRRSRLTVIMFGGEFLVRIFVLAPRTFLFSKALHVWTLLVLHLHVESIGCSTFVGYSCMRWRLYLLPFRLIKVQWVLGTHKFS